MKRHALQLLGAALAQMTAPSSPAPHVVVIKGRDDTPRLKPFLVMDRPPVPGTKRHRRQHR